MMLSISKSINQYDNEVRLGNFKKNASKIETLELFKKEMLIVGFGRIGRSLIKRCLGFDMKINIFDPFVTKKQDGKGLGLSIVSNSIRTLDGSIEVTSENGRTNFCLNFPLKTTLKDDYEKNFSS